MCIAFILWQCHPCYRLFLALNRDEYYSRPTLPAHWWAENENILGGKDASAGGTWFGCTKDGRLALLTNFREPEEKSSAPSRGHLTTSFLQSSNTPLEYAQEVLLKGDKYNGFNLLVADLRIGKMAYVSNRPIGNPKLAQEVSPGFHVLSNASLDSPWPKAVRGREKIEHLMVGVETCEILKERVIEEVLKDDTKADQSVLPQTGCSLDKEYKLSSIFVDCEFEKGHYGSRSMIVVSVDYDGEVKFHERFLEDGLWIKNDFCFSFLK